MQADKRKICETWEEFVAAVRQRVVDEKGDWPALCERAGVTYRFLLTFAHQTREEPTATRVMRVAQALGMRVKMRWHGSARREPEQRSHGAGLKPGRGN